MKPDQIRLHVVLEEHPKPHAGGVSRLDEGISALDGDVNGLFDQHVQAAATRGDALLRMQARWAPDGHQVHGLMRKKRVEVRIGRGAVGGCQSLGPGGVAAVHRDDRGARNGAGCACVRVADVARAEDADVHVAILPPGRPTSSKWRNLH